MQCNNFQTELLSIYSILKDNMKIICYKVLHCQIKWDNIDKRVPNVQRQLDTY